MPMPTVFSTMNIFRRANAVTEYMARNGLRGERVYAPAGKGERASPAEMTELLIAKAPDMEYLIIDTTPVPRAFFARAERLRLIAMYGSGLDHIDIRAATDHGALVANVPGGNKRSVAELALCMLLCLSRGIPAAHNDLVAGMWRRRQGRELLGQTLGVVGLGAAGTEMAYLGKALGMRVIAYNRTPRPELATAIGLEQVSLDRLLAESDAISLHIPGNAPLIGETEIARMKHGALLVNLGRGALVDMDALERALAQGRLAGAGLDVFPEEPCDGSHPLFRLPNVVCTPHIGGITQEAGLRIFRACIDDILATMAGQRTPRAVNPEVYDRGGFFT